jgi:Ca2+-binding RTX toxin-like protein
MAIINGNGGDNVLVGTAGLDTLNGFGGNDTFQGLQNYNIHNGGSGSDTIDFSWTTEKAYANLDFAVASAGNLSNDELHSIENATGSNQGDELIGSDGVNTLRGLLGRDLIDGRSGNDIIVGGGDRDLLEGGAGADRFAYRSVSDSTPGPKEDLVLDFSHAQGDRIDLATIDARWDLAGNQAFVFGGLGAASKGQVRYVFEGTDTVVTLNTDADGAQETEITLIGHHVLIAGDFVL